MLDRAGELTNGSVSGGQSFQKCKYKGSVDQLLIEKLLSKGWNGDLANLFHRAVKYFKPSAQR